MYRRNYTDDDHGKLEKNIVPVARPAAHIWVDLPYTDIIYTVYVTAAFTWVDVDKQAHGGLDR